MNEQRHVSDVEIAQSHKAATILFSSLVFSSQYHKPFNDTSSSNIQILSQNKISKSHSEDQKSWIKTVHYYSGFPAHQITLSVPILGLHDLADNKDKWLSDSNH